MIILSKKNKNLAQIHPDLCGHMHVPTNENIFIMAWIDDYTNMCWVYLLKSKSKSFETFINFHAWIQNDAQSHSGSLYTNNGN